MDKVEKVAEALKAARDVNWRLATGRRALIGKPIKVVMRSGRVRYAKIVAVRGKNILLDEGGISDWVWVPDIIDIQLDH